jgi:hypothetical protein
VKFLLVITMNPDVWAGLPAQTQEMVANGQTDFIARIRKTGEFVSTYALDAPSNSKTVRNAGGTVAVTDGPFIEAKEFLAGFYLIETESAERAYEVAAMMPDVQVPGLGIEVRPIVYDETA